MLGNGKMLHQFKNLTESQLSFLQKRLQVDLDMFGYSFDKDKYIAKCGYGKECC